MTLGAAGSAGSPSALVERRPGQGSGRREQSKPWNASGPTASPTQAHNHRQQALPHWPQPRQHTQTPQLSRRPATPQPRPQRLQAGHLAARGGGGSRRGGMSSRLGACRGLAAWGCGSGLLCRLVVADGRPRLGGARPLELHTRQRGSHFVNGTKIWYQHAMRTGADRRCGASLPTQLRLISGGLKSKHCCWLWMSRCRNERVHESA